MTLTFRQVVRIIAVAILLPVFLFVLCSGLITAPLHMHIIYRHLFG